MQYVKTLLSVSLIAATFHVQAAMQTSAKDNPVVVTPHSDTQMSQSGGVVNTAQKKNAKAPVAGSQPRVSTQNRTYEVPLSDYNNGGHFGN